MCQSGLHLEGQLHSVILPLGFYLPTTGGSPGTSDLDVSVVFASQATPAGALELSAGGFEPSLAGFSPRPRVTPAELLSGGVWYTQHLASLQSYRAALPALVPACLQAIVT